MDISTNHALTVFSYGTVGCVGAMAAANAVLVGAGAGAKAGAYVADYFKNESVAQNLRIKGDQLISLAGKYAATELKVAAALVAVGGSAALVQYTMGNNGIRETEEETGRIKSPTLPENDDKILCQLIDCEAITFGNVVKKTGIVLTTAIIFYVRSVFHEFGGFRI